jgi:hypothetical protein
VEFKKTLDNTHKCLIKTDRSCFFSLIYNKNSKHKDVFVYFWIGDKRLYLSN